MAFAIFAVLIFISTGTFARYSSDTNRNFGMANWNVKITNDTKDDLNSEDTQDIIFKVPNNPNVASGKIAPGTTAVATIELDLSGTNVPVDLDLEMEEDKLPSKEFTIEAFLDGEKFEIGETKVIELENNQAFTNENGQKIVTIELKWEIDDEDATAMTMQDGKIAIPVTIKTKQHIGKIEK